MEQSMSSLRPQNLTDRELLDYAHLTGYDKLPPELVEELAKHIKKTQTEDQL